MPSCINCKSFDSELSICLGKNESPLRNCLDVLLENRGKIIQQDDMVLEIGCGYITKIRDKVKKSGGIWFGVDPNPLSAATHYGSVKQLPFPRDEFDIVIASQSIEHWYEHCVTFDEGLKEIHRVLKPGGIFFVDYPIYLHGHYIFMLGIIKAINKLFNTESWDVIKNENWRKNFSPLEPYYSWNGTRKKRANEFLCEKIIWLRKVSVYIGSIELRKKDNSYHYVHSHIGQIIDKLHFRFLWIYKGFFRYLQNKSVFLISGLKKIRTL